MFRSKPKKSAPSGAAAANVPGGMDLLNFGNFDEASMGHGSGADLENDAELLAELAALQQEELRSRPAPRQPAAAPKKPNPFVELNDDALASALSELPTSGDNDDDASFDNDTDLLQELTSLTDAGRSSASLPPVPQRPSASNAIVKGVDNSLIGRLSQLTTVYQKLFTDSQAKGDQAKARRHQRSIDKLKELSVKATRGEKIDEDEIPPAPPGFQLAPTSSSSSMEPQRAAPPLPPRNASKAEASGSKREEFRKMLIRRRDAYTANGKLAVAAKDKASALHFVNTSKMFDQALAAIEGVPEEDLDANEVPPSPPPYNPQSAQQASPVKTNSPTVAPPRAQIQSNDREKKKRIMDTLQRRKDANIQYGKAAVTAGDKMAAKEYMDSAKQFQEALTALESVSIEDLDESEIPDSPKPYRPPPKTFLDGLMYRQKQFEDLVDKYKQQDDSRKTRMNERMAAQYIEAIKEYRAGRPVDVEALPTLPNMTPLPSQQGVPQKSAITPPSAPSTGSKRPSASPSRHIHQPEVGPLAPTGVAGESRNQVQLEFLVQRQTEFKQAAMHAKSKGNIEMAKEYLLKAKGFDPMIKAAQAGLPVSIKNTPIPPQELTPASALQPKIVVAGSSSETGVEKRGEVLSLIEKTLIEQVQKAENNRLRFTRLGDVGKVKLFEEWAKHTKSDLLLVREVAKQGLRIPQFHYEQRAVPNADLFPELAEDLFELTICNAVQVPIPSGYESQHANIFVKYELPYPPEKHQAGQTKLVAGTISPDFNEIIQLQVGTRKSRGQKLLRVLKRAPLKLEVYQKGGFLRSDKLLGTAEVKLETLETTAQLEESVALKGGWLIKEPPTPCCVLLFGDAGNKNKRRQRDNKKAVGGMLRVRVRVREPLGDTKLAIRHEKWLVLDN